MKFGAPIPKKASKHSQGSVARLEKDRHKAYFFLKPQEWNKDKDNQIKCSQQTLKLEKRLGLKSLVSITRQQPTWKVDSMETGYKQKDYYLNPRLEFDLLIVNWPNQ